MRNRHAWTTRPSDRLLDRGAVKSLAEIARLGHVTRARVTQIMNPLLLAPDIQEEILFLPPTTAGRDSITEREARHVLRSRLPAFSGACSSTPFQSGHLL